jgi:hypothetical protein
MFAEALAKCGLEVEGDVGTVATKAKANKEMVVQTRRIWGTLAQNVKAEKVQAQWRVANCTLKKTTA